MATLPNELETVRQAHWKTTEEICDDFADALISSPVPPVIYHYTDDQGLRGIFESGRLWLTDIFSLNDPSELNHGITIALKIMEGKAHQSQHGMVKLFCETFQRAMTESVQNIGNYFVCCFSTCGDELGQWRAYADDGQGFAIGFNATDLETAFTNTPPLKGMQNTTFPVTYDDSKLRKILEKLVSATISEIETVNFKHLGQSSYLEFLTILSATLAMRCCWISLFFKHEAYRNEQEYRFLQVFAGNTAVPQIELRSRPYSLVRYRGFDWKAKAAGSLIEIKIGPASEHKVGKKFAFDCLSHFVPAAHKVSISPSEIPYTSLRC